MIKLYDLARCFTSTTGTGSFLTVGSPVSGFLGFTAAGVQDGETVRYAIRDGVNSEVGNGVWTAATNRLTRNVLKSTASDSNINLSGSAQVMITPAAEDFAAAIGSWNYWKIRARSADPDSAPFIANLQLRPTIGGSGATVADSTASSGTSANAYTGTGWQPSNHATINGAFGSFTLGDVEQYVVTHFTTAQSIAEIAFNSVANARTSCAAFDVLVSSDNATWYLFASFDCNITTAATQTFKIPTTSLGGTGGAAGAGGATVLSALTDVNVTEGAGVDGQFLKWDNATSKWLAGHDVLANLTDVNITEGSTIHGKSLYYDSISSKWVTVLPAPSATSWRIRNLVAGDGNEWTSIAEVQFRTAAGVASVPSGGTVLFGAVGFSGTGTQPASNAFDNVPSTHSRHDNFNGHQAEDWLGYQFATARAVVEVMITNTDAALQTAEGPSNFVIEYLDATSGNWISLNYYTSTGWASGQTRTFAVSSAAALQIGNMGDFSGSPTDLQVLQWSISTHKWGPVSIYATATPSMDGSGAVGTSTLLSRSDHVHPSDTSRAPLANPSFTGNVKFSVGAALTAAGTTQAGALALTNDINELTTVASGSGAALPVAVTGMEITVINAGANAVLVYPVNGGSAKINALAANASLSVAAGAVTNFYATSSTQWRSK